ncbi:hypothetical protein Tco_0551278 [Tanacetum coccineum]
MAPLPPRAQRHPLLRYQVEGYIKGIVHDFEQRLDTIFGRQVNWVHTDKMRGNLVDRLRMVYTGDEGQELFTIHAWRRLFKIRGPLVQEFILEFFSTCRMSDTEMVLDVADTLCFQLGGARSFLVGDRHLRRHAEGRKSGFRLFRGHFIGCLAAYFGLVSDEGLMGLLVITCELPMIDLHELVVAACAPEATEDVPVVDEGVPAVPPPAAHPRTML